MSWWSYNSRGTLRDTSINIVHKELLKEKGAYWRPYSFYTAMNTFSSRPTGRAKSVHIKRSNNYRTQDKTLCGLIILNEVENFNWDDPRLCRACKKSDAAIEQSLLNQLSRLASKEVSSNARTYTRNSRGEFAKKKKVRV